MCKKWLVPTVSNLKFMHVAGKKTRKVTDLLAVLSRPGALVILEYAENGIKANAHSHLHMGLTRKQYYARLSELVQVGMVDKVGGIYLQTRFGALVWHDYIPRLKNAMKLPHS